MTPRLVHVTTVPESLGFISDQISHLVELGWDVHLVTSPGPRLTWYSDHLNVTVHGIEMPRSITPFRDISSTTHLTRLLRSLRPEIVHAHTPKGGLLGMIGATAARVPVRIYHMRGLPYVTALGAKRAMLEATERTSCGLSTQVFCQSESLRAQALAARLCAPSKIEVILGGSNGVDAEGRFHPRAGLEHRTQLRAELGIPESALVVGFVGRLVRDKGICELAEAWRQLARRHPTAHLLLVGPFEERDPVPEEVRRELEQMPRVHIIGYTDDVQRWYGVMDVFTLPSHREGFPNAPLEASAMELPIVATRIPGCVDAVEEGETGLLVAPGSNSELATALDALLSDPTRARRLGQAGRARVLESFQRKAVTHAIARRYRQLLERHGVKVSSRALGQKE